MANFIGKDSVVLIDQYDVSAYFQNASPSTETSMHENTGFGAASGARIFLPGLVTGALTLTGLLDGVVATGQDAVFNALRLQATAPVVTIFASNSTIGRRAVLVGARMANYTIDDPFADLVGVTADFKADGGLDYGVSLHALGAETGTGSSASYDHGAEDPTSSSVATLHVTAIAGGGTWTFRQQHSADNSIWVDWTTFTAVTAISAQRAVVASGTMLRYRREDRTVAGGAGNSITFAMGHGKRVT